jgi:hypothetical protein
MFPSHFPETIVEYHRRQKQKSILRIHTKEYVATKQDEKKTSANK